MGYKIEIVLISVAVFLCGAIVLAIALTPSVPTEVVANTSSVYEIVENTTDKAIEVDIETQDNNQSDKININTATKYELMELKGIGETISQRIIDYRKGNKFDSIEEIVAVDGIGEKKFEDIKNLITVE